MGAIPYHEAFDAVEQAVVDPFGDVRPQIERLEQAVDELEALRAAVARVRELCASRRGAETIFDGYLMPADVLRALDGEA